jgi:hypothetical protein
MPTLAPASELESSFHSLGRAFDIAMSSLFAISLSLWRGGYCGQQNAFRSFTLDSAPCLLNWSPSTLPLTRRR